MMGMKLRIYMFISPHPHWYCTAKLGVHYNLLLVLLLLLLLLLLGGCIRDREHNATPSISLQHKCLHVYCLMPDISCNAVNVIQWSSAPGWARQSQGIHIRYYLILGAITVTSKTCSVTSYMYNGRNGRNISIDLYLFCALAN